MLRRIPFEDGQKRLKEENGVVSLWIGRVESQETLEKYLTENYEDMDENAVLNEFCLDFGFNYYDHDGLESYYFSPTHSLKDILSHVADEFPSVPTKFMQLNGDTLDENFNAAIFLFYYRFVPDPQYVSTVSNAEIHSMKYVGTVGFDEKLAPFHQ